MDQEQELDPAVAKLLEHAKVKQIITWEDVNEFLPQEIIISDRMEEILILLEKHNIQLIEEEPTEEDADIIEDEAITDEIKIDDSRRKHLVNNEKDSGTDDPIRLYLREIGKEHLLTAEQEVQLSKKMEDGENIIKNVIKNSGMMIPEFFFVAQKAYTRIDIHESGRPRKEINEEMAEKRRLRAAYGEYLKPILAEMRQYVTLKKQLYDADPTKNIFEDEELVRLRQEILPVLQNIDIQSEEIERFSARFMDATFRIQDYRHRQEKKAKDLRISEYGQLRTLGKRSR